MTIGREELSEARNVRWHESFWDRDERRVS